MEQGSVCPKCGEARPGKIKTWRSVLFMGGVLVLLISPFWLIIPILGWVAGPLFALTGVFGIGWSLVPRSMGLYCFTCKHRWPHSA